MNVFVLSTGRTGSLSLERACQHMTNFTAAHESRCQITGDERINFPDQHIEIDNRLSWFLGRLDKVYGKNAIYIHMVRDSTKTAESYRRRWNRETGIVRAYAYGILKRQEHEIKDMEKICLDYVENVNENITLFLKDKPHKMIFRLEEGEEDLRKMWDLIKAEGDFDDALASFTNRHNEGWENEKAHNAMVNKVLRIVKKLPYFLRNA
jgi:hypothetical protein